MIHPNPTHDPAVRTELMDYVASLYQRARTVLGQQCEATPSGVVNWYADGLRTDPSDNEETKRVQVQTADEIVTSLIDPCVTTGPEFWTTALGRAVAWHIGYRDPEQVPRDVIAALLGVTRQAIWAMAQRKVGRGGSPDFTGGEVREILRARWRENVAA
jgi:hypothetical protein